MLDLTKPVAALPGIGPSTGERLAKLHIHTVADLLQHYPFRYEDYADHKIIADLVSDELATIVGSIWEVGNVYTRNRKIITKAIVNDGSGSLEVLWFNQPYMAKNFHTGQTVQFSGKVKKERYKAQFIAPAYEIADSANSFLNTGRLVPVYSETAGISSRFLRAKIAQLLDQLTEFPDWLPISLQQKYQLLPLVDAIKLVHFPKSDEDIANGRKRIAFDELTQVQLAALVRKYNWQQASETEPIPIPTDTIGTFVASLPFPLTGAQNRVVDEILSDISRPQAMNRLLEGDVGSGKTVVAAIALYATFLAGKQSVVMAPTEILANQHFATLEKLLKPFGITTALVTGSTRQRMTTRKSDKKDEAAPFVQHSDVLVGTHALLSDTVQFRNLGLVVIDEQHKFGVEQRALLRRKGHTPHVLTMTATPIPRTLALTLYGNLDLSIIDEMPKGRSPARTFVVPPQKRAAAYRFIAKEIREKQVQAFVVCPFIEPSETYATAKAATVEYDRLANTIFPEFHIGLLHGRMKPKEKDAVMEQFRTGEIDILVATPLVEVGVDIPNATIMMIEAADRFGLAQLHQLRGRVGRGSGQKPYCLLFTELVGAQSLRRLKAMETEYSGLKLAEIDLHYRGAGEVFGTLQHGAIEFRMASLTDSELIAQTHVAAQTLFTDYYLKDDPAIKQLVAATNQKLVEPN